MLTVHHLEKSRSQRVLWILEELGLPYEVVRYRRDPATMLAPESLRAVHPLGKSPVLVDDALVVAESGAILEYIVERHGGEQLVPPARSSDRQRYRYWMHYAEGSLMPLLVMRLVASRIPSGPMPFFIRPLAKRIAAGLEDGFVGPNLTRHLAFVEGELGRSAWFSGDELTACDIQMSYPLEAALTRAGVSAESHPNIVAFVARFQARPAYQRALARGV
jgi:glutathione S-transferase